MKKLLALTLSFALLATPCIAEEITIGGSGTGGGGGGGSCSGDINGACSQVTNLSHVANASLANTGLVNSSLTLGSTSISLGATALSVAGVNTFGLGGNISASGIFGTTGVGYKNVARTLNDTTSSGTIATNYDNLFGGSTLTATSATTITNQFGTYFKAPTCSTNVTCTHSVALGADSINIPSLLDTGVTHANAVTALGSGGFYAPTGIAENSAVIGSAFGMGWSGATFTGGSSTIIGFGASGLGLPDVGFSRDGAGAIDVGTGAAGSKAGSMNMTNIAATGTVTFAGVTTGTNADFACFAAGGVMTLQTSACTISSIRFKKDIEPLRGDVLAEIAKLQPVAFNMKDGERPNPDPNFDKRQIGLTAENVASVDPRLAIYEDDGTTPKSYRQEAVIGLLVAAVKEMNSCKLRVMGHCWF